MESVKFMQSVDKQVYRALKKIAKERGINVQELIRVDILPTFLYGPLKIHNRTIAKWERMGLVKNGTSRVVSQ